MSTPTPWWGTLMLGGLGIIGSVIVAFMGFQGVKWTARDANERERTSRTETEKRAQREHLISVYERYIDAQTEHLYLRRFTDYNTVFDPFEGFARFGVFMKADDELHLHSPAEVYAMTYKMKEHMSRAGKVEAQRGKNEEFFEWMALADSEFTRVRIAFKIEISKLRNALAQEGE